MIAAEQALDQARERRDAARAALDERVGSVRDALSGASLGERARHDAVVRAQDAATEAIEVAVDVARESRWVVAATLIALLGWLFRRPLAMLGQEAVQRWSDGEPGRAWHRWQAWIARKVKP